MTYCQFVQEVKEKVEKEVDGKLSVSIHTAVKNNSVKRTGLLFARQGINVAPAIYLEGYYEEMKKGRSLPSVVSDILSLYREVRMEKCWEEEKLLDYERLKDRIVFRLINRKANEDLLQTVPFVSCLDLAVVFYILVEESAHGMASMLIKDSFCAMWKTSAQELYELALKNTPRLLPYEFGSVQRFLEESFEEFEAAEEEVMYMLGNRMHSFGAVAVLYPDRLRQIGRVLGDDYYILPSSVHEVLLVPARYACDRNTLDDMVKEVNTCCVEEEEILSGHAYYYDRKKDRMTM